MANYFNICIDLLFEDSPAMNSDSILETIAHQEDVIRANKEVLEQLYADIAELEGRKAKNNETNLAQQDSDSSRNTLSEINAIAQLENEISKRNKHISKLLGDVKVCLRTHKLFMINYTCLHIFCL